MVTVSGQRLALLGGEPTVTVSPAERWQPPVEREIELCTQLIRNRYLSAAGTGFSRDFENKFGAWLGIAHCASQNNGTSTLQAAYFAVGVGPGDEVIHPCYTWICSIAPAVPQGSPHWGLPLSADGFDLFGQGRGPLTGDCQGYRRGDLPVSEAVHPNIISLPALIDPAPDYLEQYIAALEKVTERASDLR